MIKGDAGERGTRVGGGERWCGASISNFLFPDELACVENVACNVATHTRESKRELHILSKQTPGRGGGEGEENDGGTRRRPGASAAAPQRNIGNPAFAEYFFDDFQARVCVSYMHAFLHAHTFERPYSPPSTGSSMVVAPGMPSEEER